MHKLFFGTQNLLNREISRFSAALFLAASLAVLAGCGAGQALPSDPPAAAPGTAVVATATTIQLLASSTQMPSSGASTVDLTAVVLSATRQTLSGRTVTFTVSSPLGAAESAFVSNISASGVSDDNGQVTARLNLGSNKTNRLLTIGATADSASASNLVDVTGTTVAISGNSSVASGNTTSLTISVKDSAGSPLQSMPVTVVSGFGNTIALTSAATNSSGQTTATVTADSAAAAAAGTDEITVTAAGVQATQTLTISSASFTFTGPAADKEIPLTGAGSTQTVTVSWTDVVTPPVGPVSFSTSRGTVSASTSPLVAGSSSVTVSSTTAGPAILTASGPTGTPAATLNVIFVATSASTATVQALPGTVQVTSGSASQTNNSSTITAVVRDVAGNLVKNANVSFNLADTTGGSLTSSTGVTDVSGSASVTYVAGTTSSAQNGVTITATVDKVGSTAVVPAVTGITTLTVSGQSLLVRLGTDNKVGVTPLPQNANTKTYVAVVTDAAGNPVVGTTVQFTLRPTRYRKGTFVPDPTNSFWVQSVLFTCNSEDVNNNGSLDLVNNVPGTGEDLNGSGALEPGAVASVNATGVTDASGIASATITYAKSYSLWVEVTLSARTAVTSNDPPTETTFFLPGLAEDYTTLTIQPPGRPSPFGSLNATCADLI